MCLAKNFKLARRSLLTKPNSSLEQFDCFQISQQEANPTNTYFLHPNFDLSIYPLTMKKSSPPQSPCARRHQSYFKTPKGQHGSIITIVPPPAPRKRSQTHQVYYEPRYNHVFGGRRSLYVPSCQFDLDGVKADLPTVQLKPRLTSCLSQLSENFDGFPLLPILDDCCSDDDSEASDFSPLPQALSDLPDF